MDQAYTYAIADAFTYDNLWTYTWTRLRAALAAAAPWQDNKNRLVVAEKSGAGVPPANRLRLEFTYDSQGRRRTKKVFTWDDPTQSWTLTETQTYLYDQWNVIADQVYDSSFSLQHSSFYLWGLDLSNSLQGAGGVGGLLAAYTPNGNWFYPYDGNGNVAALVSTADGAISATYDYSPFGLTVSKTGPAANANTYRFSTKPLDQTGLYYYGYRFYSPELGRWPNRNPVGETTRGKSLYAFVFNNPCLYFDDTGLEERKMWEVVSPNTWHLHSTFWGDWWLHTAHNVDAAGGIDTKCPCDHIQITWCAYEYAKEWGFKLKHDWKEERSWCYSLWEAGGVAVGGACGYAAKSGATVAAAVAVAGWGIGKVVTWTAHSTGWSTVPGSDVYTPTTDKEWRDTLLWTSFGPSMKCEDATAPCGTTDFDPYKP